MALSIECHSFNDVSLIITYRHTCTGDGVQLTDALSVVGRSGAIGAPPVGVTTVFHPINKITRGATFIGMTTDLQLITDLQLVSRDGADVQFTA